MLQDDITHASRKYDRILKYAIQPLLDRYGISHFCLSRVTTNGQWSVVESNAAWIEHCTNQQYYRYNPTLVSPKYYQSGVIYASAHDHEGFEKTYKQDGIKLFDLDHFFVVIDKQPSGCEFSFFATSSDNLQIINTYINKLNVLRNFINYFKTEYKSILINAEDHSVDLKQLNPATFFKTDNVLDLLSEDLTFISTEALTPREKECLSLFLKGKTAKETAVLLQLSHRTVEEYLSKIKTKLNCKHKRELITLFS